MASFVAKALCPHLIEVKSDMARYVEESRNVMDVLLGYDENLAQASLDEAYLDVTSYCAQRGMDVESVVAQLRREVEEKTGLTVSVGIAVNKMLAKICSDRNKPNGQFRLAPERAAIVGFMKHLSVRKVPGIGRVTERILDAMGVQTCGDIWTHRVMLHLTFDGNIEWLLKAHLGLASHVVQPGQRHERKSVGRETTFRPTDKEEELLAQLRECCDQVERDLERLEFDGRTITLVAKHDSYQRFNRAWTNKVTRYYHSADDLYAVAKKQFDLAQKEAAGTGAGGKLCLRLIGVRLTNLRDLKEARDGGVLGKMFKTAAARAAEKSGGKEVESSDDIFFSREDVPTTEDEEQRQIRQAMEASLAEVQKASVVVSDDEEEAGGSGDKPSVLDDADADVRPGETKQADAAPKVELKCPICDRSLWFDAAATETQKNTRLNQHIDGCLSGFNDLDEQQRATSSKTPASTSIPASASSRKLDTFFSRKK